MYIFIAAQWYRNRKANSADSNFLLSLSNVTATLYACSSGFRMFFQNPLPADTFKRYRINVIPSNCIVSIRQATNARNR